jgi:outer membrane protein
MKTEKLMRNKLIIALAIVAVVLMAASQINTDPKKFGYVNSMEILSMMPEMKDVQTQLEAYGAELDKEYQTMVEEYQKKAKEYQDGIEKKTLSETMQKLKYEELMDMEKRLQNTQQAFEQELVEKQEKLMSPLADRITNAIKDIAKEKQLGYVFDTSKGMLLYADELDNITVDVKTKLGIKDVPPPTNNGGTNSGQK